MTQILGGLALLLPSATAGEETNHPDSPPGLTLDHCTEYYGIGELQVDAAVQTSTWEPFCSDRNLDVAVQTIGDWEPLLERHSKSAGPELGTLDEVDLLPPLLADNFVTGQLVWTNTSLRLDSNVLMPSFSMGRVLRQHERNESSLWIYFQNGGDLVSVAVEHLMKALNENHTDA